MTDPADSAIRLEEQGRRGRYARTFADGAQAELVFSLDAEGDMVLAHTFTPPRHRGQGIALSLVERAVADARAAGRRIVPLCPYVAAEFGRHPEWAALAKR